MPLQDNDFDSVSLKPVTSRPSDSATSHRLEQQQSTVKARNLYNESAGLYPLQRDYPTLRATQRIFRLLAYATVMIVIPGLMFRFAWILWSTEEGLLNAFGQFSLHAVAALFAMVGLVGTLLTASEGIELAIDLQDNTLRIANQSGRRKL
ncbi:hypothetical protein [Rhodopirellula halodulae]|uniref:hypothetical protein n=1 Tax=Rhodopirellula halodulae TaxID=2894198 RepID=UPI001E61E224|nr:hypothetical protein [Rhodopirellula sp. JC737]MCC9657296.1 hypothetical protein [Rhodopirellula sp. JC737]